MEEKYWNTHGVYIDCRQIVRIGVRQQLRTGGIKCTRDLEKLFSEIGNQRTWRDLERAVGSVSRPDIGSLERLCLHRGTGESRNRISIKYGKSDGEKIPF